MGAIFFDLGGTLTDSKPGITRSIQYALDKLGHDFPSEDELTWCIGPSALECFDKLLGDSKLSATALRIYRERYADIGLFENRVYPGIEQTVLAPRLADLAQPGVAGKPENVAVALILQQVDDLGRAVMAVATHRDLDPGPMAPDAVDDVAQDPRRLVTRWPLARTQQRQHRLGGRRVEACGWAESSTRRNGR